MINLPTLSFLVFLALIAVIIYVDRKRIQAFGPLFVRKTTRGKGFIISTGRRFKNFWDWVGNIAIVAGFLGGIYIMIMLAMMFVFIISIILCSTYPVKPLYS